MSKKLKTSFANKRAAIFMDTDSVFYIMMDVYISRFFNGYDDTCFSVMIYFGAKSNIISSEIV